MRDALIVQWSRLGDVIQSRPLLRSLKLQQPTRTIFCCDSRYADIAVRLPEVDVVLPVDLQRLVSCGRTANVLLLLTSIVEHLTIKATPSEENIAIVLSRSEAAALLPRLLGFRIAAGYQLERQRLIVPPEIEWLEQKWSQQPPNIHLSDLWIRMAGLVPNTEWLPNLHNSSKSDRNARIGILCDSGDRQRTPDWNWLQELVRALLMHGNIGISLFGVENDLPLDDDLRFNSKLQDLRGKTELRTLPELLSSCTTIIGPDTGALHLAGALNIPTIGLFAAGASPRTTGVYAANALGLEVKQGWNKVLLKQISTLALNVRNSSLRSEEHPFVVLRSVIGNNGLSQRRLGFDSDENGGSHSDSIRSVEESSTQSALTIIIPERGQHHLTDALLAQLSTWTPESRIEIIVVSSDMQGPRVFALSPHQTTLIASPEPLSFASACNRAAKAAAAPWLLFLNNDLQVTPSDLNSLWQQRSDHSLLTPVAVYPDGLIQNAGARLSGNRVEEIAHGTDRLTAETPDALSAIAVLISRDCFQKLGGFDATYHNGYEDLDLSLRARQAGISLKVCQQSRVVHYRSSTPGRFEHEEENHKLFMSRWGAYFRSSGHASDESDINGNPRIIVVSEHSARSAGAYLRWNSLLEECGLKRKEDYGWIQCDEQRGPTDRERSMLAGADLIIVFRPIQNPEFVRLLLNRKPSQMLITDTDDLIYDRFVTGSVRGRRMQGFEQFYRSLAGGADLNLAATIPIIQSLARHGIVAQCWATAPLRALSERADCPPKNQGDIRIGFVGHPAHTVDLGIVLPALEYWLNRDERISFCWWGSRPGELTTYPRVIQGGPIIDDYLLHLRRIRRMQLDMALVPLLDSPTNRARSPIKFFDWSLLGVPAIYSEMEPYSSCVMPNITGLLASDVSSQWIQCIDQLISNSTLRMNIARASAEALKANPTRDLAIERMRMLLCNSAARRKEPSILKHVAQ